MITNHCRKCSLNLGQSVAINRCAAPFQRFSNSDNLKAVKQSTNANKLQNCDTSQRAVYSIPVGKEALGCQRFLPRQITEEYKSVTMAIKPLQCLLFIVLTKKYSFTRFLIHDSFTQSSEVKTDILVVTAKTNILSATDFKRQKLSTNTLRVPDMRR